MFWQGRCGRKRSSPESVSSIGLRLHLTTSNQGTYRKMMDTCRSRNRIDGCALTDKAPDRAPSLRAAASFLLGSSSDSRLTANPAAIGYEIVDILSLTWEHGLFIHVFLEFVHLPI